MEIILLIAKIICVFIPLIWFTLFTIYEKKGWCEKWWGALILALIVFSIQIVVFLVLLDFLKQVSAVGIHL